MLFHFSVNIPTLFNLPIILQYSNWIYAHLVVPFSILKFSWNPKIYLFFRIPVSEGSRKLTKMIRYPLIQYYFSQQWFCNFYHNASLSYRQTTTSVYRKNIKFTYTSNQSLSILYNGYVLMSQFFWSLTVSYIRDIWFVLGLQVPVILLI